MSGGAREKKLNSNRKCVKFRSHEGARESFDEAQNRADKNKYEVEVQTISLSLSRSLWWLPAEEKFEYHPDRAHNIDEANSQQHKLRLLGI